MMPYAATTKAEIGRNKLHSIVRLNVGGRIYDVSRSLLYRYPNTLLARLTYPEAGLPLFLEGNGDRFQYCLDYMRNGGSVHLPATTSKRALLLDLEYYGFEDVEESKIYVEQQQEEQRQHRASHPNTTGLLEAQTGILEAKNEMCIAENSIRALQIRNNILLTKNRIFHSTVLALLGVGSLTLGSLVLILVGMEASDSLQRRRRS